MTVALAQVCTITMGQAPPGDSYNDRKLGVPLIAGAGDFTGDRVAPTKFTTAPTKLAARGDIVLSIRASIGAKVWADTEYCLGRGVAGLRPGPALSPRFLWHWLSYAERDLAAKGRGATFLQVNKADIGEMGIPALPITEQRRIAAILDHADAIRAKRRDVLAHIDSLNQAIFHDMFGDPDDAIDGVPFGEVVELSGGRNLVAEDANLESPFRVLKISAVTTGRFKPEESKPLPATYVPPGEHLVRPGDLLMSRANTTELVGAVAYVNDCPANLALPDKVWRFKWLIESEPTFYHAMMSTRAIRRRISRLSSGTGGSMKNVSKAKLATMSVPRVPLAEQRAFAERATVVAAQRNAAIWAMAREETLFAALQSRAFRGEL